MLLWAREFVANYWQKGKPTVLFSTVGFPLILKGIHKGPAHLFLLLFLFQLSASHL